MDQPITHPGTVERIADGRATVLISQQPACGSCSLAGHCDAAEAKGKRVEVPLGGLHLTVGQQVVVSTPGGVGRLAVIVGFALPLALMVAVLVIVRMATGSDGLAALSAIGVLIPYYVIIYLLRGKIARRVTFNISTT